MRRYRGGKVTVVVGDRLGDAVAAAAGFDANELWIGEISTRTVGACATVEA
jgi:hypothetical protein